MFKYSFRCDNEACVRSEITNMMMNDYEFRADQWLKS